MKILFIASNKAKVALANERLNRYGVNVEQRKYDFRRFTWRASCALDYGIPVRLQYHTLFSS